MIITRHYFLFSVSCKGTKQIKVFMTVNSQINQLVRHIEVRKEKDVQLIVTKTTPEDVCQNQLLFLLHTLGKILEYWSKVQKYSDIIHNFGFFKHNQPKVRPKHLSFKYYLTPHILEQIRYHLGDKVNTAATGQDMYQITVTCQVFKVIILVCHNM